MVCAHPAHCSHKHKTTEQLQALENDWGKTWMPWKRAAPTLVVGWRYPVMIAEQCRCFQQAEAPFAADRMALVRFSLHSHALRKEQPCWMLRLLSQDCCSLGAWGRTGLGISSFGRAVSKCLMLFSTPFLHHSFLHSCSSPLKHPEFSLGDRLPWNSAHPLKLIHFTSFSALFFQILPLDLVQSLAHFLRSTSMQQLVMS